MKFLKKFLLILLLLTAVLLVAPKSRAQISLDLSYRPPCLLKDVTGFGECPDPTKSIAAYIKRLYQFGVGIAGILAMGMIVGGAIFYSLSAGSPDRQREGKDMISSAIWGIVLLFGSFLILKTVNPRIVALQDPSLPQAPVPTFTPYAAPLNFATSTNVLELCQRMAKGPTQFDSIGYQNCTRALCPDYLNLQIGRDGTTNGERCTNFYPLDSGLLRSPGVCRWNPEGVERCIVQNSLNDALVKLYIKVGPNFFQITEAYPPTVIHNSAAHYNGCAVDIKALPQVGQPDICETVTEIINAAQTIPTPIPGFSSAFSVIKNEYPAPCGNPSERSTGGHIHLEAAGCF